MRNSYGARPSSIPSEADSKLSEYNKEYNTLIKWTEEFGGKGHPLERRVRKRMGALEKKLKPKTA